MSSQDQDNVPEQQISYRSDQLLYCMIHHYSERHQRQIHHITELNNTVTLQRTMLANYLGQVAFFEEELDRLGMTLVNIMHARDELAEILDSVLDDLHHPEVDEIRRRIANLTQLHNV